jgi:hypothetical protein
MYASKVSENALRVVAVDVDRPLFLQASDDEAGQGVDDVGFLADEKNTSALDIKLMYASKAFVFVAAAASESWDLAGELYTVRCLKTHSE